MHYCVTSIVIATFIVKCVRKQDCKVNPTKLGRKKRIKKADRREEQEAVGRLTKIVPVSASRSDDRSITVLFEKNID